MGKIIVITGGGAGLGRAIARRLAADGHTLVLLGRRQAKLDETAAELGNGAMGVACDVGDPDSVRAAFATIAATHPAIDVLINNAALYEPYFVKDATDAQLANAINTNLAGPIYTARAVIPMMGRGAQIINVSSETVTVPHAMFSLYQGTKAGMERFNDSLHAELEPSGIRVTLARAGQMWGEDSHPPTTDPEVGRTFMEENLKRGLNLRERPIASFASAAEVIAGLTRLPDDLNISHVYLEARHR